MKCQKCQFENRDEAKFCSECGHSFDLTCPKCGNGISTGRKFCDECGYDLKSVKEGSTTISVTECQPTIPQTEKAIRDASPISGERKHITALFTDLIGYTAMTEKLDPEEVKDIMRLIFGEITGVVNKYEGFIEKFAGDSVLALFGVPKAHEDDSIRAIRAAGEIHYLIEVLSPKYEKKFGQALCMHTGIESGLAVTAEIDPERGTHGVTGDAINVASRLGSLAYAGAILVGPDTYIRTEKHFTFQALETTKVKGKTEPISIYRVLSTQARKLGVEADRQVYSVMVGRDRELETLENQVLKVVNGEGSVVNVIGEAGIGKSRLIAQLKRLDVMQRVTLVEGTSISIGKNLSFHPFIDLLKQWARITEIDSEATAFDKLENQIRRVYPEELEEVLPFVATLMGIKLSGRYVERTKDIEGEALEKLILKNIRELLIKAAELMPSVIVMEDLHWADTSSIELLESLYRLAESHRLLFINVFRPGYWQSDERRIGKIDEWLPRHYIELSLVPLDKQSSTALIGNMIDIKGLRYSVRESILERTGGNPFFLEEVVRSFIDEGAIVWKDGVFEVTDKIDTVVIPKNINDVLVARIDRIEEQTRELIKIASVIGRSFFDRILKAVANSISSIDTKLAYLKELQLIRDRIRMEELEYLFKHALVQESAYHSTLIQQRKALHLTVARATEKIFRERLKEFYGILAYHYGKADNLDKAEEYVIKAGEEALRSSASSEALNYYQEGLKLYLEKCGGDADPKKIASLEKNIAIAFYNKGQYENAVRYFDSILESWGEGSSRNKLIVATKLLFNLFIIITSLYLPSKKAKKIPDSFDNESFDLRYRLVQSLIYIDNKRVFIEVVAMVRKSNKFDMQMVVNGPQQWLLISGIFSFIGILFRVRTKYLERARDIMDRNNITHQITYIAIETTHHHCAGTWSRIGDYDATLVNLALKNGEIWHASTYIFFLVNVKTQQGKFGDAELLIEKLREISEVYDHNIVRAYYLWVKIFFLIKTRNTHDALVEAEASVTWTAEKSFDATHIHFFGLKVISQILVKDVAGAKESILQIHQLVSKQEIMAATFQATYLVGEFLTDLHLLETTVHSKNPSDVLIQRKKTYRSGNLAVKNSGKYALFRTECFGLMGLYYWIIGKQKRAFRWWNKAITEGKRLDAKVDLARTFMEIGKRLLEPNAKTKKLNGINGRGYLEKAGILFEKMGLQQDIDELEKLN